MSLIQNTRNRKRQCESKGWLWKKCEEICWISEKTGTVIERCVPVYLNLWINGFILYILYILYLEIKVTVFLFREWKNENKTQQKKQPTRPPKKDKIMTCHRPNYDVLKLFGGVLYENTLSHDITCPLRLCCFVKGNLLIIRTIKLATEGNIVFSSCLLQSMCNSSYIFNGNYSKHACLLISISRFTYHYRNLIH